MKKMVLAVLALLFFAGFADRRHQAIFQINTDAGDSWTQLLGNIANIQKAFGGADKIEIEVVAYGKGLALLLKTNAKYAEGLKKAADTGVVFAACQNSMRARNVKTEDLLPFAAQVDSGVAEIIRKQEAGWSYVRAGE